MTSQPGTRQPGTSLPMTVRDPALPERVTIWEVGPRDGLQNESALVPIEVKAEFCRRLLARRAAGGRGDQLRAPALGAAAGRRRRPAQPGRDLGDAAARPRCWCPTSAAWTARSSCGCRHVAIFASATETFAQRNLNRSLEGQLAMFEPTVRRAKDAGLEVRGYVSMCFGDPWEGPVPIEQVVAVGRRLLDLGADRLSLGDTIGVGTAAHVSALVEAFGRRRPDRRLAMHFHDTYGQALANAHAALRAGVTTLDASAGGLGGCPYAHSATGNLATEDLVWLLDGLGIEHGVDLEALVATSTWMAAHLGRPSPSAVVRALAQSSA